MEQLQAQLKQITPLHQPSMDMAVRRWNSIAKPLNSLGLLEKTITQIAGITGSHHIDISKRCAVILCADNGVVAEGISQAGSEITALVAKSLANAQTSVTVMAKAANTDVIPVDIGIAADISVKGLHSKKIAYGTQNMLHTPAMTTIEALQAIQVGIDLAAQLKQEGYRLIATGEMGIGNTTTSSAVASVLLQTPVEKVTGKGAGLSTEGLRHKIDVIRQALQKHKPNCHDPIDVLSKVGGLDIAGMTGLFLGGAIHRVPVVIDGFVSGVAAFLAAKICPAVQPYLIPSHMSKEPAAAMILEALQLKPLIHCGLCLGEGTGAVAVIPLLEMAANIYQTMSTFTQFQMEPYQPFT